MSNKSVGEVESPCGGEVEWIGVRYGFVGGARAGFRSAAKKSYGVLECEGGVDLLSVPPPYRAMEWTNAFSWYIIVRRNGIS